MKCKHCNGTGTTNWCVNGTFVDCPYCGGTGEMEMEMTNEEWRKTCSAEDFAYWLADVCAWAMEEFRCGNTEKANIAYWEKWLKQPHMPKE